MKKVINSKNAPAPIGPYSQAVMSDNVLYISGQIPINPETGDIIKSNIKAETRQALDNLGAILKEAGLDYSNIVKCSIFISDMNNFAEINEVYGSYFSENYPAREVVQVAKLPLNVNIEISAIANLQ